MVPVKKGLDLVTTNYAVFEKDQVLTPDQLNSVADYADDQTRLTRVKLSGVGLASGLRVSLSGSTITVSPGFGVTTDGDLLYFQAAASYERFQNYDKAKPAYAPLYVGGDVNGNMLDVYELVADPAATSLAQFSATTGKKLSDMVAVLLMESYVKDDDLCNGTDCDNLGKETVQTPKLLLVEKGSVAALLPNIVVLGGAETALPELVAARPVFSSAVQNPGQLNNVYRDVCAKIHADLVKALPSIDAALGNYLAGAIPTPRAQFWIARLVQIRNGFDGGRGSQYYYDFLRDLVETFDALRAAVSGDNTLAGPDPNAFPKHLVLGDVVPGDGPGAADADRTAFYPSPVVSKTAERLALVRFLARKLDAQIACFTLDVPNLGIRVTPSRGAEAAPEERAIPYYYQTKNNFPLFQLWNWRLHQRGMDAYNYSYRAPEYGGQGGALNPLDTQLGAFSFFRVEGHLGTNVEVALATLRDLVKSKNLPFAVRAVLADNDPTKIVKPSFPIYSDLHWMHYVLRQDVIQQLEDADSFSRSLKEQVQAKVDKKEVEPRFGELATTASATVQAKSATAREKLNHDYVGYDRSWADQVQDAITTAESLKQNLSPILKTEFNSPYDGLVTNTHVSWIDDLATIIQTKDDAAAKDMLFSQFVQEHYQLEHFAGVTRGGTLVLIHDAAKNVIADFMLPYRWAEAPAPLPEPKLPPHRVRTDWVLAKGFTLAEPVNSLIDVKIAGAQDKILGMVNQALVLPAQYADMFGQLTTAASEVFNASRDVASPKGGIKDKYLGIRAEEAGLAKQRVDYWKQLAAQPNLPNETRAMYTKEADTAEDDLVKAIQGTVEYLNRNNLSVSAGSDGNSAIVRAAENMATLSPRAAVPLRSAIGLVARNPQTNAGLRVALAPIAGP